MRFALIDPFFDVSHQLWAEGLKKYSSHEIDIISESAHNWKWKMAAGAIGAARRVNLSPIKYDGFIATDMLNVAIFKSLLKPECISLPILIYFHENQITYPWSSEDQDVKLNRDHHYGFINFSSCLVADCVIFNSNYHKNIFIGALPDFLKMFPDHNYKRLVDDIDVKSRVLPIGLELPEYSPILNETPTFIWNHRWEYDKNPETFFESLFKLKKLQIPFKLIVTGKSYNQYPDIFLKAKRILKDEIFHFGMTDSRTEYLRLLSQANIVLVTSNQDFFGISTVEAIAAGCFPILPDRLAFPEHVPLENRDIFYKNENELLDIVVKCIHEKKYLNTCAFSEFVQKYSWNNLIEDYDVQLEKLQSI